MKIKKRWIILMTAMTLIAVAGLAVGEPSFDCDWSVISAADVAWLITATIFVLMMTPGLSFFYSEKVGLDFSQHDEHYGLAHIGERELAEYEEHIREKNK
ncbi:MAG: ammonium transporter [Prevotella sp.]|nr:ammonium transporter [Prevotella sp.]